MTDRRKLIEVSLPLDVINAESAREKSIRHGHPSTLHLWWARRPLAACRAVLFAQLVDDPSSRPEEFPTVEAQDVERQRLFGIIEELVKWDNSTNEEVLEAARAEILKSTDGDPPPILDPFAGGGSIPLEAQRLGLEAFASDLNPVAVLINKALIEIPPKWAGQPPVHPDAEQRMSWSGAEGLAEDVRRYGEWMRDEAEQRIGHLYPKAKLDDGSEADVIAWIWARTVTCPNPACGATMPLASTFWLGKKKGKEAWINPIIEGKHVRFEVGHGPHGPPDPPKVGRGAKFRCLVCGEIAHEDHVKAQGMAGRMGAQLMAIAAEGNRRREYVDPDSEHAAAAKIGRPTNAPELTLSTHPQYMGATLYGITDVSDAYSDRQLVAMSELSALISECRDLIESDGLKIGMSAVDANSYAGSVATYLAFSLSKMSDRASSLVGWYVSRESTTHVFARQVLPMVWDYAETSPLGRNTGSWLNALAWTAETIEALPTTMQSTVWQGDARDLEGSGVICTDPPYYDNVPYADLSDYFYPWLRQALRKSYPSLFDTVATPKANELVADSRRHGGRESAKRYFEDGFTNAFTAFRSVNRDGYPMAVFYAFKQSELVVDDGVGSTGWSTVLEGLLGAGWMVTATWPIRTEASNRMRGQNSNVLASSIVLACRPRSFDAGVTDRQGLLRVLGERLPDALGELQKASIAPVDLRQAAIGPGMAVFSQFEKVVEPDGSSMRVRTALGLINQVLDQVLDEQQAEFDRETRWAIQWFSQFFEDEGPYGTAEQLAVSMDVSIEGLRDSGIVTSGGGKVRLLSRDELDRDWDPASDDRVSVWEATQHLVKRLDEDGESSAAELFARLGGLADSAQTLATILYSKAERDRPGLAGPYNALVASWPSIQRIARHSPLPTQPQQQTLDEI